MRAPAYLARVAPLEAIAQVVSPRAHSAADHKVSVRVEVVAAGPLPKPAPEAVPVLEARASFRDSEAAQLMAASTEVALSASRGALAYAAAGQVFATNALSRGVCIRVRA